ncbi:hypothetical protein BUE80_DR013434 [Diplocarpon rosae]|nr:hypothetical protein BUE80_DR013434 [Diplocarpon rosae]
MREFRSSPSTGEDSHHVLLWWMRGGSGDVTDSQLFGFAVNHVLDQAWCEEGDAAQLFTFGGIATSTQGGALASNSVASSTHRVAPIVKCAIATLAPAASSKIIAKVVT